mmetsp:Transcript_33299/g.76847  ORF Transcript_33299/g.76847 Transcript_33299/m.76847 type:complete len:263 (-) Transcript_33299:387-1175(-)
MKFGTIFLGSMYHCGHRHGRGGSTHHPLLHHCRRGSRDRGHSFISVPPCPQKLLQTLHGLPSEEAHVHVHIIAQFRQRRVDTHPTAPPVHRLGHVSERPRRGESDVGHGVPPRLHDQGQQGLHGRRRVNHLGYGRTGAHGHGPPQIGVVAQRPPYGGKQVLEGPLPSEEGGKVAEVVNGSLADRGNVVSKPAAADGGEGGGKEIGPELLGEDGYETYDVEAYAPFVVFREVKDSWEEALGEEVDADDFVERPEGGDEIEAHL